MVSAALKSKVKKQLIRSRHLRFFFTAQARRRMPAKKRKQDMRTRHKKRRGRSPAAMVLRMMLADQRSSCNTLCCDWLASDSAETAIDWRVDSAWLLAASWLVAAKVRLDEPVCSTLIRFLLKS